MKRNQLRARWSGQRGVTLVELIVVIAVAGILIAVSSPTVFGAIRRERQVQVVNDIANHFRKARNQAMARGEAVLVVPSPNSTGANGGILRTYRLTGPLPSGGYSLGSPGCNMDTEDITTDDCPVGATCVQGPGAGGVCWGPPLRNCRQLGPSTIFSQVETTNVNQRASSGVGMRYAYGSTNWVCFNPDGSATTNTGAMHSALYPAISCDGESYLVWIGKRDPSVSFGQVLTATQCGNTADQYESVSGYVLRVNNNGEIGLRSPK